MYSVKVAFRIAEERRANIAGETLIKPCTLDVTKLVFGREQRTLKRCVCPVTP